MVVMTLVLLVSISYAVAFRKDVPDVLVKRTLIFIIIAMCLLNYNVIIKAVKSIINDLLGVI